MKLAFSLDSLSMAQNVLHTALRREATHSQQIYLLHERASTRRNTVLFWKQTALNSITYSMLRLFTLHL